MNREKLQIILKELKYNDEMARQHMAVVGVRDMSLIIICLIEALLEEK